MAFGNATKGYVKKHSGGGGGGGSSDYDDLLNKPSINGTELVSDTLIGTLSGQIHVSYNSLTDKPEIPSGGVSVTDITSDILDSTKGINISTYKMFFFQYNDTVNPPQTIASGLYVTADITNGMRLLSSTTNNYCAYDTHVSNGVLYLTKSPDGSPRDIYKVYGVN